MYQDTRYSPVGSIFSKVLTNMGVSKKWQKNLQSLSLSKQLSWAKDNAKKKAIDASVAVAAASDAANAEAQGKTDALIASLKNLVPAAPIALKDSATRASPPAPANPLNDYLPFALGGAALLLAIVMVKRK